MVTTEGVTTLRSDVRPPPGSPRGVDVGAEIGRYIVLGELGRGGMGVVLRAYDPELEREVALKTLKTGEGQARYRAAVLAEARALAKLRHPNVVGVYDVGEHDDLIWIAMELVRGSSLRSWSGDGERSAAQKRRVLREAGAGLMAAHEAGIVHCDIKPDNIVVAERAHVVDFGLAHGIGTREGREGAPDGTRAYLAPELFDGEAASVASDVYAFCITAWEVLTGERPEPFATEDLSGQAELSRRLASALRDGLRPTPSQRPQSLAPILEALDDSPRRVGRLVALLGVGAIAVAWGLNREPDCEPDLDVAPFRGASMNAIQVAIEAQSPEDAQLRAGVVSANVDAFRDEYARQYRDACRSALVRGDTSKQTFEAQTRCLSRRREQLVVLLDELAQADGDALREAPRSIAKLSSALSCEDAKPDTVAAAFEARLDRVEVLELLSRFEEAQTLAEAVEADAQAVGDRPAELWARYRRGRLLQLQDHASEAAELLADVHWQAEAADVPNLASTAGLYVMWIHAAIFDDTEAALGWAPHVEAAVRRAGDDVTQRAKLIENRGIAKLYGNRVSEAYDDFVTALEMRESAPGDVELGIVSSLGNLGIALEELGRYDEAIEMQSKGLRILERRLGPTHPHTARVVDNLGTARLRKGEVEVALQLFERALQARRVAFGDDHRSTALSWTHIGLAQLGAERTDEALEAFETARTILEALDDPGNLLANCLEALAHTHAAREEWPEAAEHARAALQKLPGSMPEEHPEREALREILAAAAEAR